jgi:uncharacterized protein (TIGR02147 family)
MKSRATFFLEQELSKRVSRNRSYSQRSFARSLGISHTLLSLVLSQKRGLSPKTLKKIGERLGWADDELTQVRTDIPREDFDPIALDTFALISDWYHYAILSLLELRESRLEPAGISKRLGTTPAEAKLAIARLKRLNLISLKDGRWKQSGKPIIVENAYSTAATRKHQQQILRKAEESLENDPFERHDLSSTTFVMDPKLVGFARERIRQFRRRLVRELEGMGNPSAVYELAVQIFPLSKEGTEK